MKKKLFFAGMAALLLSFGLVLTGCDNGGDDDPVPTVTSVTVDPATASVVKGATQQFTATVAGENNPAETVTWTVEGGGEGTSIDSSGVLTVAAAETATTLTVKATSTVDTTKSGTATVTVTEAPTVTSVTVSPATASVAKGGTQEFTATVTGENNPATTVTWSVEGGGEGTSVSSNGVLTVASNESAETLTVKATSTVDTTKVGTATVSVAGEATVTSVAVSPATASVAKGATQEFTATVDGENNPATTVTWSVEGGVSGTSIDSSSGLLTVASNETAETLTVKATSTVDTTKVGTATVTVTEPVPTVTSVTVSPATASVLKGATQEFTATVDGENNPATTVTWSVEGGVSGTSIDSSSGLLTVASNETAETLTVKATSTVDTTKFGTATVTVTTPTVTSVTVDPATASVAKGATQQFTAVVAGENSPAQTVTWAVEGNADGTGTSITDGLLTVGASESAATLTVKATSTVDTTKVGEATVTVTSGGGASNIPEGATAIWDAATGAVGDWSGSVNVATLADGVLKLDQGDGQYSTLTLSIDPALDISGKKFAVLMKANGGAEGGGLKFTLASDNTPGTGGSPATGAASEYSVSATNNALLPDDDSEFKEYSVALSSFWHANYYYTDAADFSAIEALRIELQTVDYPVEIKAIYVKD